MANTLKFGNGQWGTKVGSALAFNDEDGNFKPLPFNFTRSTSATRINKDGLIEVVTNNKPRIDFLNDSNGALLLEPQRSNLLTYSSSFDLWSQSAVSITVNNNISPSGIQDADLITANGANTQHYIQKGVSQSAKTYSVFAKMGTQRYIQILTSGAADPVANFDLQDGFANMVGSNSTASIEDFGNGWWRCILQTNDSLAGDFYINYASSLTMGRFGATTSSGTLYLWGAQAEVGNHQTSYIPTQGAISTRVAEVCTQTPPSGIIGQTEGTIYAEFLADGINQNRGILYVTQSGFLDERIALQYNTIGQVQAIASSGGITQGDVSFTITGRCKAAIAYNSTNYELFINGVSRGTFSGLLPSGLARLDVGNAPSPIDTIGGFISSVLIYNTRLSNAELQALTS